MYIWRIHGLLILQVGHLICKKCIFAFIVKSQRLMPIVITQIFSQFNIILRKLKCTSAEKGHFRLKEEKNSQWIQDGIGCKHLKQELKMAFLL